MERDQDQSNEKSKATCSELAIARVSHCHLGFGRNLKADRVGNVYWKKREGLRVRHVCNSAGLGKL